MGKFHEMYIRKFDFLLIYINVELSMTTLVAIPSIN